MSTRSGQRRSANFLPPLARKPGPGSPFPATTNSSCAEPGFFATRNSKVAPASIALLWPSARKNWSRKLCDSLFSSPLSVWAKETNSASLDLMSSGGTRNLCRKTPMRQEPTIGTKFAARARSMAKMIGEAARYTTAQSIRVFQRMLITTMLVMAAVGVFEGADFSIIVLRWGQTGWAYLGFALLGLAGVFYLCRYQSRRIDHYERERKQWRKGAIGECMVADVLGALSDEYWIINDVTTASGNLDHIVVGPTGVFAIETKNWRGTVTADGDGELMLNGSA